MDEDGPLLSEILKIREISTDARLLDRELLKLSVDELRAVSDAAALIHAKCEELLY
jgi:hypothetical protein